MNKQLVVAVQGVIFFILRTHFIYTPLNYYILRKTITVVLVLLKKQKAPEKTGAVKQKKTETPRSRDFGCIT